MKRILILLLLLNAHLIKAETENSSVTDSQKLKDFEGLKFGVGISLTLDTGKNKRVKEAVVDPNGIIRIKTENSDVARVMLESHYFFSKPPSKKVLGIFKTQSVWGHGPFLAFQPGTNDFIDAVGLGWMLGLKRKEDKDDSWNIGLGYVVDPKVQILGDGMVENEPLPEGETSIRFKETSQGGAFLLVSFSF